MPRVRLACLALVLCVGIHAQARAQELLPSQLQLGDRLLVEYTIELIYNKPSSYRLRIDRDSTSGQLRATLTSKQNAPWTLLPDSSEHRLDNAFHFYRRVPSLVDLEERISLVWWRGGRVVHHEQMQSWLLGRVDTNSELRHYLMSLFEVVRRIEDI